jgi:DNA-binding transcriptional ArsR family regulator
MDMTTATGALGALAQETRLAAFRLIAAAGPKGLSAGEVARALGVPHNTMSAHLAVLSRARLVTAQRDGRSVIYAVDLGGVRALLAYLLQECCGGQPALCAPLLDTMLAPCCEEEATR